MSIEVGGRKEKLEGRREGVGVEGVLKGGSKARGLITVSNRKVEISQARF